VRSWLICLAALISASALAQDKATAPIAAVPPLTAETFAATPFFDEARLSPNGQYVAARISTRVGRSLAFIPIHDKDAKQTLINLDGTNVDVDEWHWVNDDWLVAIISATDTVGEKRATVSRAIAVERATGRVNQLARGARGQNAARLIWIARDGSPRILLGVQKSINSGRDFWPEVKEIDVSNGKMKTVVGSRSGILDYYADAQGVVRLGYGYDPTTRTNRLIYRSDAEEDFSTLDKVKLSKNEKLTFPNQFLSSRDKATTIFRPNGFASLYELDLVTMKQGAKIFGVDGYDILGSVAGPADDAVVGVVYSDDRPRIHWLDADFAKTQSDLDKATGGHAHIMDMSRNQRILLVVVGGPNQVGAYYIYNRDTGDTMRRIAYVDETLKQTKLASVTTVSYQARDGTQIRAVLTLPAGRPAKNLPLIVLPHDGPSGRDEELWDWRVQFLASKGYAVVQPNYRGSTGFGDAFEKLGNGEWGAKMQDDLNDAIVFLAREGTVDPKRVCIAGVGYGGYAAMRAAQRDGQLFRCAISYGGISDVVARAQDGAQTLFQREFFAYFKDKAPDFASVSPLRFPEQFSTPILIMHGKNDLRVPVEQSRKMADKLKAAGKDVRYVEQPLGDHHFSRQADRLQFLQEMEAFLAQHNPA
jgi:dipeptidyl aminopeptidase/acylaminoacyl peptidase